MNAIAVHGDAVGPTLFYGAGAGELPTASAVVGGPDRDRARDPARQRGSRRAALVPARVAGAEADRAARRARGRAATCVSRPRTGPACSAHIAGVLGEHGISIESVLQKSAPPRAARCRSSCSRIPRARTPCAARSTRSTVCPRSPRRPGSCASRRSSDGREAALPAPGSRASHDPAERYALDEVVYTDRDGGLLQVVHDMDELREDAGRRSGRSSSRSARTRTSGPTARASGARRSGCCPRSTTRTSSRCTRATRTCSGPSATGARSASRISGSSCAATRTRARSRTSA